MFGWNTSQRKEKKNKKNGQTIFLPKPPDSNLDGVIFTLSTLPRISAYTAVLTRVATTSYFIGNSIQLIFIGPEYDEEQWPFKGLPFSS